MSKKKSLKSKSQSLNPELFKVYEPLGLGQLRHANTFTGGKRTAHLDAVEFFERKLAKEPGARYSCWHGWRQRLTLPCCLSVCLSDHLQICPGTIIVWRRCGRLRVTSKAPRSTTRGLWPSTRRT